MKIEDVLKFFKKNKDFLLGEVYSKSNPVTCILGGQPASGKGNLASITTKSIYTGEQFLMVNGDTYRNFYPDYQNLVKKNRTYIQKKLKFFRSCFPKYDELNIPKIDVEKHNFKGFYMIFKLF